VLATGNSTTAEIVSRFSASGQLTHSFTLAGSVASYIPWVRVGRGGHGCAFAYSGLNTGALRFAQWSPTGTTDGIQSVDSSLAANSNPRDVVVGDLGTCTLIYQPDSRANGPNRTGIGFLRVDPSGVLKQDVVVQSNESPLANTIVSGQSAAVASDASLTIAWLRFVQGDDGVYRGALWIARDGPSGGTPPPLPQPPSPEPTLPPVCTGAEALCLPRPQPLSASTTSPNEAKNGWVSVGKNTLVERFDHRSSLNLVTSLDRITSGTEVVKDVSCFLPDKTPLKATLATVAKVFGNAVKSDVLGHVCGATLFAEVGATREKIDALKVAVITKGLCIEKVRVTWPTPKTELHTAPCREVERTALRSRASNHVSTRQRVRSSPGFTARIAFLSSRVGKGQTITIRGRPSTRYTVLTSVAKTPPTSISLRWRAKYLRSVSRQVRLQFRFPRYYYVNDLRAPGMSRRKRWGARQRAEIMVCVVEKSASPVCKTTGVIVRK